jgi:hypothetical protein
MFKGHPHLDTDHALILIDRLKGHVEELVFGGGEIGRLTTISGWKFRPMLRF